jgi:hypothetical protein
MGDRDSDSCSRLGRPCGRDVPPVLRVGLIEPQPVTSIRQDGQAEALAIRTAEPAPLVVQLLDAVPETPGTTLRHRVVVVVEDSPGPVLRIEPDGDALRNRLGPNGCQSLRACRD